MFKDFESQEECLKLIADILYDYDGCNTVESLKELIDEARGIAIKGLKLDKEAIK